MTGLGPSLGALCDFARVTPISSILYFAPFAFLQLRSGQALQLNPESKSYSYDVSFVVDCLLRFGSAALAFQPNNIVRSNGTMKTFER
jgi:hypothetical protein